MDAETPSQKGRAGGIPSGWPRWTAIVAGVIVIYAIVGFFIVPPIARSQIVKLCRTKLNREAKVERVRFNPFTFAASIEEFELKDRDGVDLLMFDRFALDLQLSGVFRRAWRFREIKVEGLDAVARIMKDGRPSIADMFEPDEAAKPEEPPKQLPRVLVDLFALRRGKAEFVDETRSPRFEQTLAPLDLEVRGLSTIPDESGDHAVTFGFGEDAMLRWSGRQTVEPLSLEGRVEITGIRLARIGEYAAPADPLEIRDGRLDVSCTYGVRREARGQIVVKVKDAGLKVRGLAVRARGGQEDWLTFPLAEIRDLQAEWPAARVEVGEVRVSEPHVLAWRGEDGLVNWQTALQGRGEAAKPEAGSASAPTSTTGAANPWTVKVGSVAIEKGSAEFEDRLVEPDVTTTFGGIDVKVDGLSTDLSAPVKAQLGARINDGGEASASGNVVPEPLTADLDLALRGLDLTPFQPYAVRLPGADFKRGVAALEGKLHVGPGSPSAKFEGKASLENLHIAGAGTDRLVAWDRAEVGGIRVTVGPDRMRIGDIGLDGAFLKLFIDREGKINLSQLFASDATEPARAPESKLSRKTFPVDITTIALRNATIDYTDESLILPFGTKIHSVNGKIRDLSTSSAAAARLEMEGRVADTGYVKADGTLRVVDPFASTDIGVIFRGVSMPDLTPYVAHFAGYAVKQGSLDLDVRYRIQDRRLVGDHRVVANDLVLGNKVEGAEGPGLPVRLAIALLKDKDGRIDLEVPIEGTVDSPEFAYRKVFWQAFKKILLNIVKAPFRAIGRLFGADQEDLELVGFPSGRSELPAPEQEKLAKMSAELARRAEISIEIEGRFDPVTDVEAIRRTRLEQRIDQKRTGEASLDSILEALYTETFSAEQLEAERAKFMPSATAPPVEPEPKKKKKKEPPAPPPPPPRESFDAADFYDALRAHLLAAEQVGDADLAELGRARGSAIAAVLTAPGGLEASRVKVLDPAPVKRKKQGSELVASEMTMSAKD